MVFISSSLSLSPCSWGLPIATMAQCTWFPYSISCRSRTRSLTYHSERLPLTVNVISRGNFTVGAIIPDGIECVRWQLCSTAISPFPPLLSLSLSPCTSRAHRIVNCSSFKLITCSTSVISSSYVCRCTRLTHTNAKGTSRAEYIWLFYFFQSFGVRDLGYFSKVRWWAIVGDSIILSQHLRWKGIMTLP